ncbi:precorrin-8X methylmutase [Prochlorococcus sp. MIT 1300]|uniref:precorrin-8X methylmutase n=1 Tax=Prochlorococcus sp. MIT 1300 TaxID=3096218 RepID=UPI002A75661F|nr:precorrin-8X methylmutase [Prochlorococcus sp. MIT 1300]
MTTSDHPIFLESISFIKERLGFTGLNTLEQSVLERLIHSSGDFAISSLLAFSPQACEIGLSALKAGAPILVDTTMAAAAVRPMAQRTVNSLVINALDWVPDQIPQGFTRTAVGMDAAWKNLSEQYTDQKSPIVLVGSAPTALQVLLDLISRDYAKPSLIIGMPVGFIGVSESKKRLAKSGISQIRIDGTKGGAGLAAATINALLRECNLVDFYET